ncbi:phage shock protein A [Pseudomonas fluvialis]|uniref:Phage shock protein A n=1 Tax=Pseudomonas fluvialis TaxID=1793966 RepID=A0A7X0BPZ7_9PSED|nr:hypothetical protein [Pseudomonas fluvialis]MBB6340216.1 phage shock protein A [Pseudomonas fluvialis]
MNGSRGLALALLLFSGSLWAESQATLEQQWQAHIDQMRELHQQWMAGKTPEERQKLMQQHQQSMGQGMQAMGGCPMGMTHGMGQGMGMQQGAGMGAAQSVEQIDQRIAHMEQMIEQLRAQREMLEQAKP